MPADMRELAADLTAETSDLTSMVRSLDEPGWRTPTPAVGWTVADQVSHLAFFDDAAARSATDPEAFTAEFAHMAEAGEPGPDDIAERYRSLAGAEVLAWFTESRRRLTETFAGLDPSLRLPWFGPPMSAASSLTARIMETWAHGQDVADALEITRIPTARLRHVAHISVRALPYSFVVRGLSVPAEPVRVELSGPSGESWTWGPPQAANVVAGPALDFCLLATQRRHRDDTAVTAVGDVADAWLSIAQAFAGPPGQGRPARSR